MRGRYLQYRVYMGRTLLVRLFYLGRGSRSLSHLGRAETGNDKVEDKVTDKVKDNVGLGTTRGRREF